jgi:hypothetical protein
MRKMNTNRSTRLNRIRFAMLSLLLTVATAVAETPVDRTDRANEATNSQQTVGRYEMARRRMAAKTPAAGSTSAPTARVYLEDYERVPQTVKRQYPTKAYWLGHKGKAKKSER